MSIIQFKTCYNAKKLYQNCDSKYQKNQTLQHHQRIGISDWNYRVSACKSRGFVEVGMKWIKTEN